MLQKKRAQQSLNRRITIQLILLMAVIAAIVSVISYRALESTYLRLYNQKAQDVVRMLADTVDGDRLEGYVTSGTTDEYYDEMREKFNQAKSSFRGIQYLYLFYPEKDRFIYILDAMKEGDDASKIEQFGDVYEYGEMELANLVPDIEAGRASEKLIEGADVGYGRTISAWAPVFDASGKVVGMVEADCVLSDLTEVVRGHAIRIVGALLLCMVVLLLTAFWILRQNVSQPLGRLTELVDGYEHGAFSEAKFRYNDEIQQLATSFGDMTRRLSAYTDEVARATAEKERIGAEMNVAKQIQMDILPNTFPAFPDRREFEVFAAMDPTQEIGGDFYDFFLIDDDHLAMTVGDVSGKGIPAALFMVMVKTLVKNRAVQGFSPAEVLQSVSEQLLEGNQADMFATIWFAVLELSTGRGIAANAGHEHPALRHEGEKFELQVYRHSPPIGAIEGVRFRDHGFQLVPGDTLFVYTDGAADAINAQEEPFGTARVLDALNREPGASPSVLLQTVKTDIDSFIGSYPKIDDVTMMVLKYYGPDGGSDEWK